MTDICPQVSVGQTLTNNQQKQLGWISHLSKGRDVVLAIDMTESVGLNNEGRILLRQIVSESLQPGDIVYIVPFAHIVNPLNPNINPISLETGIKFHGKQDIDRILQNIPLQADLDLRNTDIQQAELFVYQNLAQINQCRGFSNQPIKHQSVVWLTDAPLLTAPGISSDVWMETLANSPFRDANSQPSQDRQNWLKSLPLNKRERIIPTVNNREYKLTIIDIAPTLQEFCTPAPGGQETCLVSPYITKQLGLPIGLLFLTLITTGFIANWFYHLNKKWLLTIDLPDTDKEEDQVINLANNQRIAIGEYDENCLDHIDTPGKEIRGYLVRKGTKLYLEPTGDAPIEYKNQEVINKILISNNSQIRFNCPDHRQKDYEILIKIKK